MISVYCSSASLWYLHPTSSVMHLSLAKKLKTHFVKNCDWRVWRLTQLWWKHTCADPHPYSPHQLKASLLGCLLSQNPTLVCRTRKTDAKKSCYICDHQQDAAEYHSRVIEAAKKSAMVKCRIQEPLVRSLPEEMWGSHFNYYTSEVLLFFFHIPGGSFQSSSCTDRKTFQFKTTHADPHPYHPHQL